MTLSFTTRIDEIFTLCKQQERAALIAFITAGDPDHKTSLNIALGLAESGADIIEIGMPFSDPMADGPAIQLASQRALAAGQKMAHTLKMVKEFRAQNNHTPIVLMGYYNPIYHFGVDAFLTQAKEAGVDGLLVVDLPPETDEELCIPAQKQGINFIRLATPTTDEKRLPIVLQNTSGFVYYVSVAGITGTKKPDIASVGAAVKRIKAHSGLPIAVGFGVRERQQARDLAKVADGVIVGSALVDAIAKSLDANNQATATTLNAPLEIIRDLRKGIEQAAAT